jgi:type I restriction enzyme S subunit
VPTGGIPQLTAPELKKQKIYLPSIDAQRRIVSILDRFDTLCNDLSADLPAEIEARQKQYEYYRDKLLTFKEASL